MSRSLDSPYSRRYPHLVQMPGVLPVAWAAPGRTRPGHSRQARCRTAPPPAPGAVCQEGEAGELGPADGRLDVGHVGLHAGLGDVVAPAAAGRYRRQASWLKPCSRAERSIVGEFVIAVAIAPPSPMGRFLVA